MVAYSFKKRFIAPIQVGLGMIERINGTEYQPKQQTIRAVRRRHAWPGEEIQLYCGMRTKSCFLIGRATCSDIRKITIDFPRDRLHVDYVSLTTTGQLDAFAHCDGFINWDDMRTFWRKEHRGVDQFVGVLIMWKPLSSSEVRDGHAEGDRSPGARRRADT